jgi:hypothetical protein
MTDAYWSQEAYPANILVDTRTMTIIANIAGAPPGNADCATVPIAQCNPKNTGCEVKNNACTSQFYNLLDQTLGVTN